MLLDTKQASYPFFSPYEVSHGVIWLPGTEPAEKITVKKIKKIKILKLRFNVHSPVGDTPAPVLVSHLFWSWLLLVFLHSLAFHHYILVNANPAYGFLLADKRFASCSLVSGSLLPVLLSWSCDIFTPVLSTLTVTSLTVVLKFFFTAPGIFLSSAQVVCYGQPVLCLFQSLALGTFSFRSSHTAVLYILLWFSVSFLFLDELCFCQSGFWSCCMLLALVENG